MALSSSLYTGTSGLINMGNTMQVISNNISNSNTLGFKKGTAAFADTLSQSIATQAGVGQVGRGVGIGEVANVFDQGSLQNTGNVTDIAIGGDGFFIVKNEAGANLYTRAGNFKFDETGQFVNPQGFVVQGWNLDSVTGEDVGAIGDIVMKSFTSPPAKSTEITVIANLDATADSKTEVLANSWDGSFNATTNIDNSKYQYQTVVKVYDALGSPHDITIYYDKKNSTPAGDEWEYMIATNPEDDKRSLVQGPLGVGTSGQGLLAKGTITFSKSSGDIIDLTMYRFDGRIGNLSTTGGDNKPENVHFNIINSDKMTKDAYGMTLSYGGAPPAWSLPVPAVAQPAEGATAYGTAIVLSTSKPDLIQISLDGAGGEVDLEIKLDKLPTGVGTITFDINNIDSLNVQNVDAVVPDETVITSDNVTLSINDPTVITKDDASNIQIEWDGTAWSFVTTPDLLKYPDAVVGGDATKAIIDLWGTPAGAATDINSEDIVFTFTEPLVATAANPGTIDFKLVGTNAWTKIEDTELEETGYFNFKTDFLGGEFGTTESNIKFNIGSQYINQTWTKDAMSTTQFAKASTTVYQDADGYAAGSLEGVDISTDGTITGLYSNGELIPLFRVGLAKFLNNNGLFSVGGNLFRETRDSGSAITNKPGENGLGTLSPNSLEMSNVDISEEFVNMITTQRAFQANSKTITTVDDMLNTVIGMKR